MLASKHALSLPTIKSISWNPFSEPCMYAWYKYRTGLNITPVIDPKVLGWEDSSPNDHLMEQTTVLNQPTYNSGEITFVSGRPDYLSTNLQIELPSNFLIGISIDTQTTNGTIIGDITTSGELFKYSSSSKITVQIGGSITHLELDAGTFSDNTIIITRDGSNVLNLWVDNVLQTGTTPTLTGTALIDVIGARFSSGGGVVNGFDGVIREIQIYDCSDVKLVEKVYLSLKHLTP
tara:strand:+ start:66 stop:767 length:702 start_codon:yes stop_codon:yes gene_type:complete